MSGATYHVVLARPSGSVGAGDVMVARGYDAIVSGVFVSPPGAHPTAPIRDDLFAIRVSTTNGDRWLGVEHASIGPDLRVHWTGGPG